MQVTFRPQLTTNFKGSFEIKNLDAFVEDFEEMLNRADMRYR